MRVNVKSADGKEPRSSGALVNAAIADAVARMREEEVRLRGEISRLQAELGAVARARAALERGSARTGSSSLSTASGVGRLRAPRGFLPRRILEVVAASEEPVSRAQIIDELRASGYEFTLAPAAITRELVALVRARKLKREGADNAARYVAVAGRKAKA